MLAFVPAALLAALYAAWQMSAAANFLYPFWYDVFAIDEHIAEFGPENRYRQGFEFTSDEERYRLFGAIVDGIQDGGRGLDGLQYYAPDGRRLGVLLRPPEITHLRDVANLVATLRPWGWAAWVYCVIHLILIRRRRWPVPSPLRVIGVTAAVAAVLTGVLLLVGPRRVFYRLHELIFPPDNQWFFYYQDSLMSTMMKAPYLFGGLGAQLALLTIVVFVMLAVLASRIARPPLPSQPG
jgi:hypothetical protein